MNEDVVHHIWSGEIVQLTKYIEYVKDLESNVGITHHKMTLLYYVSNDKKKVMRLATSRYGELNVDIKTLERMIEQGFMREVTSSDLKYFYPHISKRVCSILGWDLPKNVKQRCKIIKKLEDLREETKGQTRMLWHHDYWDGPRSGVMLWKGEKCWFSVHQECNISIPLTREDIKDFHIANLSRDEKFTIEEWRDYDFYREYKVYRIPEENMEAITYNHELFCKYVGTHNH
jgi:hypothetical protein